MAIPYKHRIAHRKYRDALLRQNFTEHPVGIAVMEIGAYFAQGMHQSRAIYLITLLAVHRRLWYSMSVAFTTAAKDAYRGFLRVYEQQHIFRVAKRMNGFLVDTDTVFLYVY